MVLPSIKPIPKHLKADIEGSCMKTLLALTPILAFAPLASAQSTFHGDNARTGVYAGAGPVELNGVKWAFKSEGPIVTSPTLSGGVVYIASLSGHLFAVD